MSIAFWKHWILDLTFGFDWTGLKVHSTITKKKKKDPIRFKLGESDIDVIMFVGLESTAVQSNQVQNKGPRFRVSKMPHFLRSSKHASDVHCKYKKRLQES